jgi:protein-tyrosine phosphatase
MPHHEDMSPERPFRICFVCSGNICRSPIAEVVMDAHVTAQGLADLIEVDSAGTGDWHIGERADRRAVATLAAAGHDATLHRARQFDPRWFAERDLVIALDRGHYRTLRSWAATDADRAKVQLLRSFDPVLSDAAATAGTTVAADATNADLDVPDPYYDGPEAFADVLAMVEAACSGLLDHVRSHRLGSDARRVDADIRQADADVRQATP